MEEVIILFKRVVQSRKYDCLAADVKEVVDIEAGSICTETDTGKEFIFSGTAWVPKIVQTSITGSLAKEPFSGSTTVTHTFTQLMNGFSISNDGISNLTFTIGSDTYTVKEGETWEYHLSPFTEVTVTTTEPYRAWGLM